MWELVLVTAIALAAVVLFIRETLPVEVVGILVLASLALTGLVSIEQAFTGFSNAATITVGAMFVLSAGLRETGALDRLGRLLISVGLYGPILLVAVVLCVAGLSAFVNNTATVAVMLPLVLAAARRRGVPASKLLIPLSYASQFGGVCTLVGTSTNLLVDSLATNAGLPGFGVFDFAPVGIALVGVGTLYLVLVAWWLLPAKTQVSLEEAYALRDYLFTLNVPAGARLVGRTIAQARSARRAGISLVEVVRDGRRMVAEPQLVIEAGDCIVAEAQPDDALKFAERESLTVGTGAFAIEGDDVRLVELVVAPNSQAIGRDLSIPGHPWPEGVIPLAVASRGDVRHFDLATARLVGGDVVLLLAEASQLAGLRDDPDFILLSERGVAHGRGRRATLAVALVAGVVTLAAMGFAPISVLALVGAALMVVTKCLPIERAYRSVELRVLLLLATMFPLGIALQTTGAATGLVDVVLAVLPDNPLVALAVVYGLTALLTEFVSNNATAVLMTPIAIALGDALGVSAVPFVAAVAFAASTSFSTPIGYPTNSIVHVAGGYAFRDFVRVGVPLNLLFWVVAVWLIPRVFPF